MKNKMKKIFSKITILVLLVAMVIPYTNIPKVEAATEECNGTWENHTNYYFFLQAEHPKTWATYLANENDSTATTYYTSFLYNFPKDGTKLDIYDAGFVELEEDGSKSDHTDTDSWSIEAFYSEMLKMYDSSDTYDYLDTNSSYKGYSYSVSKNSYASDNTEVSYFIHGPWGFAGLNDDLYTSDIVLNAKESIATKASYKKANNLSSTPTDTKVINALVDATVLPSDTDISHVNIGIASGSLETNENAITGIKSAIKNFNNAKGLEFQEGIYKATKSKTSKETTGDLVMRLYIRRSYDTKDFFEFSSLRKQTGGAFVHYYDRSLTIDNIGEAYKLYFPTTETASNCTDCTTNDYVAVGTSTGDKVSEATAIKLVAEDDKGNDETSHWFLAPSLFQISYKVCKDGGSEEGKVTLSYDANKPEKVTAEAKNIPSKETKDEGSDFTIPETKPELSGYKFKEWNISPKCDSTGYEAGYTLEDLTNDTTLYACWVSTSGTNNGKTGVLTYTGLFAGIIALAGGSYYIMKKKNLFRQI